MKRDRFLLKEAFDEFLDQLERQAGTHGTEKVVTGRNVSRNLERVVTAVVVQDFVRPVIRIAASMFKSMKSPVNEKLTWMLDPTQRS